MKWLLLVVILPAGLFSATTAAELARSIHEAGLDASECYRVRDLSFQKDDLRIYLTEGNLIFSKAVNGRRFAAVFTTDVPGGEGEIILFPPHRSERLSLAAFAKTPNLDEHINTILFLFTDGTGEQLLKQIQSSPEPRKAAEAGLLMAGEFGPVLQNISASYETRLVQDLLTPEPTEAGFFYGAVRGRDLGMFDMVYDPRAREQIALGQIAYRENRSYFDTWTSFMARPYRLGQKKPSDDLLKVQKITVEATLQPDLNMKAVTSIQFIASGSLGRAIGFDLSRRMRVVEAFLDGQPVEIFARDSMRANLIRGGENDVILAVMPTGLQPGKQYTLKFVHEGNVVMDAGSGVYYVGARNSWYPTRNSLFANYDLTFRYPASMELVATGNLVDERTEGEWKIARRTTPTPIRFAGFNVGKYEKASASRAGVTVDVYANRNLEAALQPRMREVIPFPTPAPRVSRRPPEMLPIPMPQLQPNPKSRLEQLAVDVSAAMEYFVSFLGPPPLQRLTVSPIPGVFGQGFPGLIYLSTLTYLSAADRPGSVQTSNQQLFFSDLLQAHEAAHQWWGNLVTADSYQDDWIMEALANYSALMFLEKRKGRREMDAILASYRQGMLRKGTDDRTLESAGPIIWGIRLNSSQTAPAWRTILYEKGSWIIHMLRARMGDAQFAKMLGELVRRYKYQPLTTDQLRLTAAEFLPAKADDPKLEAFFEQWVYGTGIPTLKLGYSLEGKAPKFLLRGTITQTGVAEDFSALVPVAIQAAGRQPVIRWIRTSDEPVQFTVELPSRPSKVLLDPAKSVLAVHD